ncbi:type IX secretion system membrane protein PorP/SprF [Rhodohalobacter sp. 8-1]|uniref:type IX secretion system membrane protein PorP/SprF n=1 Tax=Rhodohalobacter sp. 8-1 TaxID=3131972 RepID=UPI0030EE7187
MNSLKKLLFIAILFFLANSAFGQDLLLGPSTGSMDSKSVFSNPAIMSFQNSQIALGLKGYHLGFFDESGIGYKQGYFSVLFPRLYGSKFGGGANIQYFDSPIFSRSQTGVSTSYRIINNLSVGANISLYHLSYNSDNFVGFDFEDPVFGGGYSKFTFNSSAGIYFRPLRDVELATGVRNLNEPNISLSSGDATVAREFFGGASYRYGLLKGTFELIYGEYGIESSLHAELFSSRGFYLRSGANTNFNNAYLEGQAHVGRGYSVNYQFELPVNEFSGNSSGTHMFSVVYEFNKLPKLPEKQSLPPTFPTFESNVPEPSIPGDIFLSSQTDHVIYREKEIVRQIDEETITPEDLSALSDYDLGELGDDPGKDTAPYSTEMLRPSAPIPETVELTSSISPQYREAINYVLTQLGREDLIPVNINTIQGNEIRAAGLRNEIWDRSGQPIKVEQITLPSQKDSVRFNTPIISPLVRNENLTKMEPVLAKIQTINTHPVDIRNWTLHIVNNDGYPVHEIRGNSTVPDVIEWDWILENGSLIEPGVYRYSLNWRSADGNDYQSNERSIYVQKIHQKITIDITKDVQKIINDPDTIDIILKNN